MLGICSERWNMNGLDYRKVARNKDINPPAIMVSSASKMLPPQHKIYESEGNWSDARTITISICMAGTHGTVLWSAGKPGEVLDNIKAIARFNYEDFLTVYPVVYNSNSTNLYTFQFQENRDLPFDVEKVRLSLQHQCFGCVTLYVNMMHGRRLFLPAKDSDEPWIQIKLHRPFNITAVQTKQFSEESSWLETFKLSYSDDGETWTEHEAVLHGNALGLQDYVPTLGAGYCSAVELEQVLTDLNNNFRYTDVEIPADADKIFFCNDMQEYPCFGGELLTSTLPLPWPHMPVGIAQERIHRLWACLPGEYVMVHTVYGYDTGRKLQAAWEKLGQDASLLPFP